MNYCNMNYIKPNSKITEKLKSKKFFDYDEHQYQRIFLHKKLQNKLFSKKIQSCNTKSQLNYYIKPKNKLEALHDNFLKYGNKSATSFLIIDIDKDNSSLEEYILKTKKILNNIKPNWITKTDNGFHVGFILDNPIFLNNSKDSKNARELKLMLTMLLKGDTAGSHRLIGYWRNPLTHDSNINLDLNNFENLFDKTNKLFKSMIKINILDNNKQKPANDNNKIQNINLNNINKDEFVDGNRNNFLFRKVVGMLYNGLINNENVLDTLIELNNDELKYQEIQKIAKSIRKYNIQPNQDKRNIPYKKGEYWQKMKDENIHNYKNEKKEMQFERQKLGQKITTIKRIENTLTYSP